MKEIQVKDIIQPGADASNRYRSQAAKVKEEEAISMIKQHEERFKLIERIIQNTLLSEGVLADERRQALLKVKEQIKLMGQLHRIRGFDEFVDSTITGNLKTLPAWQQALSAIVLKLFHTKNFN